jgi:hypothetical protein
MRYRVSTTTKIKLKILRDVAPYILVGIYRDERNLAVKFESSVELSRLLDPVTRAFSVRRHVTQFRARN